MVNAMSNQRIKQTFGEVWTSFVATVKAAYDLAPFLVIVLVGVVIAVTYIAVSSAKLMMGIVLLLVLGITIIVRMKLTEIKQAPETSENDLFAEAFA